jgi:hypothetical protein
MKNGLNNVVAGVNVPEAMDKDIAAGLAGGIIVVMPTAYTKYAGSMYSSSVTTGDREAYIAEDLVSYMDKIFTHSPATDRGGWNAPVCLMHSKDPQKDATAFQSKFEQILAEAGDGTADFSSFVFPSAEYKLREFAARCLFHRAWFPTGANFTEAAFLRGADFSYAGFC